MNAILKTLFALALLCPTGLLAQSLQLADGRMLLGEVVPGEVDGEGLRVRRLDNGGVLDLRWDHLSQQCATELKKKFNMIGSAEDELFVRADEVTYEDRGAKSTVTGLVVDHDADPIVVMKKGVPYPIDRKTQLRGMRRVEVPASQVYTQDEFYNVQLNEIAPGDNADKHIQLAEILIKFRDYERAGEHLQRAKQLENTRDQERLATLMDRLERFKKAANELGMIEDIQIARSRGTLKDFEKGRETIAEFESKYPNSKLKSEFEREKQRFEEARTQFFGSRVAEYWRREIGTVASKAVGGDGMTIDAARDYAENGMRDDIVARVQKRLGIEPEEITTLWAGREKFSTGTRTEHFSYGDGSWVLGEKAILKGTAAGDAVESNSQNQGGGGNQDVQRFTKALQQALERRRKAQQTGSEPREQTEQGWWSSATRGDQAGWLRAYYAEFSGDLTVKYASAQKCISCFGQGFSSQIDGNGQRVEVKCFLCQGTKWVRSFKAY